jgi:hypothetical protein
MSAPEPGCGCSAAVGGLARELEALRRETDRRVPALAARVENVAGLVARLAQELADRRAAEEAGGPASWLALPAGDTAQAGRLLAGLADWMAVVYLRYTDAAISLPDCWLWHPDVVEELLWLWQAWQGAYTGQDASIGRVADWHDRQRPGVVDRIKNVAGWCSIENHQPGHTQPGRPDAPAVGGAEAAAAIAAWWATGRTGPPPPPTADQLAAATAPRPPRGPR